MNNTEELYRVLHGPATITLPSEPVKVGFTITIDASHGPVTIHQPAQVFSPISPKYMEEANDE